jgi:crossover junction endodeoxyribonuclease RusA
MSQDQLRPEGELRVELPWPPKVLSPNARIHWARKAKATGAVRFEAKWSVLAARGTVVKPKWPAAALTIEFRPPDKRRRDMDNLIASMKAATDGIADALGIDDSKFQTTYRMGEPVKGGAVLVTVRSA